jgi:L-ascorbate metabolism protein UlaG (beta-lactamase superfamily)
MIQTRRTALVTGSAALLGFASSTLAPIRARGQDQGGDAYETESGRIVVHPVHHASLVMETPVGAIYADPVGGAGAFEGLPAPDLVFVTHEHGDHFDPETLSAIVGDETRLITNPAVRDMLPEALKAKATALANGESTGVGDLTVEAIPAYNTTQDRLNYHPKGRDNGYVLTIGGRRIYIAGDTEDIPEMRALEDIFIAFVPMNQPYTMDVDQAASAVNAFAPTYVYPYHYRDSDIDRFAAGVDSGVEVVRADWYSQG